METERPLDSLNAARGKRVIVELNNKAQYVGKLSAFDIHVNIVLRDAEERQGEEVSRKLGKIFIRGAAITLLSLSET